jgi:hypothetical protein
MPLLKKFPALSCTIAGVITAVLAVWESANATGLDELDAAPRRRHPGDRRRAHPTASTSFPSKRIQDAIFVARTATA